MIARAAAKHAAGEKPTTASKSLLKDTLAEQRALKAAKDADEKVFKREMDSWKHLRLDTSSPGMSQRVYEARRQLYAQQQAANFPPLGSQGARRG